MSTIFRHGEMYTAQSFQFETNCAAFGQQSGSALFVPFFSPCRDTGKGHVGTIFGTVNLLRRRGGL